MHVYIGLIRSGKIWKNYVLKTVRKIQKILLTLEESQEKAKNFIIHANENVGAYNRQLYTLHPFAKTSKLAFICWPVTNWVQH